MVRSPVSNGCRSSTSGASSRPSWPTARRRVLAGSSSDRVPTVSSPHGSRWSTVGPTSSQPTLRRSTRCLRRSGAGSSDGHPRWNASFVARCTVPALAVLVHRASIGPKNRRRHARRSRRVTPSSCSAGTGCVQAGPSRSHTCAGRSTSDWCTWSTTWCRVSLHSGPRPEALRCKARTFGRCSVSPIS